jgi:hypothetical protein
VGAGGDSDPGDASRARAVHVADVDLEWIEQAIAQFPQQIASEISLWVTVLRGEGRWEHPALGFGSIRRYIGAIQPVMHEWIKQGTTSLRQVTSDQVAQAIAARQGNSPRFIYSAVRPASRL